MRKIVKTLALNSWNSLISEPYSSVIFVGDNANWVLSWEIREVQNIANRLGIRTQISPHYGLFHQSIFICSKYFLLNPRSYFRGNNHIGFPYFHGYPSSEDPTAILCYENLKKFHHKISRIQVSHTYMQNIILDTGIDPGKVFLIPIGINPDFFLPQTVETKQRFRKKYGIPQHMAVIGSFQKDGVGWGEGLKPKLIKGPDIFLDSIKMLKERVPELFILLSGPARGYMKKGLEKLNVPFKHIYLRDYPEIGELFQCIDLTIVASREEGGPKAVLESMASGVPLVTTRVGQAMDLIKHGENAFMVDVRDAEGIAFWAEKALYDSEKRSEMVKNGLKTAGLNTYSFQTPLWSDFFKGFVNMKV